MSKIYLTLLFSIILSAQDTTGIDTLVITRSDTIITSVTTPLPVIKRDTVFHIYKPDSGLFFQYRSDIDQLVSQIDSLKSLIRVYEKKQKIPKIKEELLELIGMPSVQHRVTLNNGTVIMGEILQNNGADIVLQTTIGKLVLHQGEIKTIEAEEPKSPQIELIAPPRIKVQKTREIITGTVINKGNKRADFVRIIANLWTNTAELSACDSAFVNGQPIRYKTGVVTDTALEPGKSGDFRIIIDRAMKAETEYRTFDIRWQETE